MSTQQPIVPYPISLAEDASERVRIADSVSQMVGTPGWSHITEAMRVYQDMLTANLMGRKASQDGAPYAQIVGEMNGLAKIGQIIEGLMYEGELAEAEVRQLEEV